MTNATDSISCIALHAARFDSVHHRDTRRNKFINITRYTRMLNDFILSDTAVGRGADMELELVCRRAVSFSGALIC